MARQIPVLQTSYKHIPALRYRYRSELRLIRATIWAGSYERHRPAASFRARGYRNTDSFIHQATLTASGRSIRAQN